jgi:class 3 adenylate cyclase
MKKALPNIAGFETELFGRRDPFSALLRFSIDLMVAKQAGLIYGTDQSREIFISPDQWDRGVIHRIESRWKAGWVLKYFGKAILRFNGLSPVPLYRGDAPGKRIDNDGIIAYLLRNYPDFYRHGVKIVIVREMVHGAQDGEFLKLPVLSYDGKGFDSLFDLKVNLAITTRFKVENFIGAYVPDYGALVINTVDRDLLLWKDGQFLHDSEFRYRLDLLIWSIETGSLACLGRLKGQRAVEALWRKESALRAATAELKKREADVERQKRYLMAVGAVTEEMLDMEPVMVCDGVYSFIDMVGSTRIRSVYSPQDYFFVTNQLREIAANLASSFFCRLDNFMGDAFFLQNVSVFDPSEDGYAPTLHERTVLMVLLLVSMFRELDLLIRGLHPMDREQRVKNLLEQKNIVMEFRSGIEVGPATVGPVGSRKRKIVTAIGEAVDRASRFESSGVPNEIHMSSTVMGLLDEATVSRSTKLVYPIIAGLYPGMKGLYEKERSLLEAKGSVSFFDLYRAGFDPFQTVVTQRSNVRYKEFTSKTTYLLRWNRQTVPHSVCFGI